MLSEVFTQVQVTSNKQKALNKSPLVLCWGFFYYWQLSQDSSSSGSIGQTLAKKSSSSAMLYLVDTGSECSKT